MQESIKEIDEGKLHCNVSYAIVTSDIRTSRENDRGPRVPRPGPRLNKWYPGSFNN